MRARHWLLAAAVLVVGGNTLTSCEEYDLDEKTPAGWDQSIYSWLDGQGNFTNMVRLIDDLNYAEVLDRTGSKTLFAADDEAFARFYQKNDWGVKSYEGLSQSQKRMLLFGAMIDNSYQVMSILFIALSQATDCLKVSDKLSSATRREYESVRKIIPLFVEDNPFYEQIAEVEHYLRKKYIYSSNQTIKH